MTLTFEKLGTFVSGIHALSYQVTDSNPDLDAWDCSSGTCVDTHSDVCPASATICEVQGFRTADSSLPLTLTLSAHGTTVSATRTITLGP